jgi:bacillithiol biosynthesis cysteine-adding enzyme BshC
VFWIATEDHDFEEVAWAEYICCNCNLTRASVPLDWHQEGRMVGRVTMDERINEVLGTVLEDCPDSEFRPDVAEILRDAYQPGFRFGDAFARMMSNLLGNYGIIFLDPLDAELKQLAAPLYAAAAQKGPEIAAAIAARSQELVAEGYHAQVAANANSFPLFILDEAGGRRAVIRQDDGRYQAKSGGASYTAAELASWAGREPERFSPNVTLRAVVQDYLLPTLVYFGGAAEIAYFAQTAEAYRILQRPATPIRHRASLTFIERHTSRVLERFALELPDLFVGPEALLARVVEEHLGAEAARAFRQTETVIAGELDALQAELRRVDPTLADALNNGRRKIMYQLEGLRTRYHHAQMRRDEATHRQLERAMTALFPHKGLQERRVSIVSLLARHGRYAIGWIHDAINLGSDDHQIVYF